MKDNELDNAQVADAELDGALARMADDVPPMPADFHDRWMNAVREEAKKNAAPAAETKTDRKTVSMVRWTRILSVAAVFVFLIGGTMLWRSSGKTLSISSFRTEKRTADLAAPAAEEPAAEQTEDAGEAESAAEVSLAAGADEPAAEDAAEAPVLSNAYEQDAAVYEAEETEEAEETAEEPALFAVKAAGSVQNAYTAADSAGEADNARGTAYEAAAPASTAAPVPETTPEPTAAPTPEPTGLPEPPETPAPEPAGFLQEAGVFFTDMGDFLLAALPYLLVLAVPAAAALVISRKAKKGKKEN